MKLTTEHKKLCKEIAQNLIKKDASQIQHCDWSDWYQGPVVLADGDAVFSFLPITPECWEFSNLPDDMKNKFDIVKEEDGEWINSKDEEVYFGTVGYWDEDGEFSEISDTMLYDDAEKMLKELYYELDDDFSSLESDKETVDDFKETLEEFVESISDCIDSLKSLGDLEAVKRFTKIQRLIKIEADA